jgi:hypothetical protein
VRLLSSRPAIDIFIPNTKPYYSTLDTIVGSVTVTVRQPTPFSDISINLVGVAQCSVDNPNASGGHSSSDAIHRFLGVSQPIPEDALPLPMVLQPGQTYTFPFSFVVPPQMLPRACSHQVNSQPVRDAHLQLPPSLNQEGSTMGLIFGGRVSDSVKITYSIKARVSRQHQSGEKKIAIAEANKTVNIRPVAEELPPLDVDVESSTSNLYCLRKESTIRRGLTCTKQGRLSFTAAQPRSFRLGYEPGSASASTYLRARLRFDPATDSAVPPRLGTLTSKLCATTHWATAVRHDFPGLQKKEAMDRTRDEWSDAVPLASLSVENVEWTKHDPSAPAPEHDHDHLRPASALSSVSGLSGDSSLCGHLAAPSGAYREGGVFYTAQVLVPLSLPEGKACLPTFHACLVSRVYALKIALSLDRRMCSALELLVPVQVSAAGSENLAERLRQEELAAQAVGDAEQMFEPRLLSSAGTQTVVVPEIRLRRTASGPAEAPPEYEVLSFGSVATRRRMAVHV